MYSLGTSSGLLLCKCTISIKILMESSIGYCNAFFNTQDSTYFNLINNSPSTSLVSILSSLNNQPNPKNKSLSAFNFAAFLSPF